MYKTKLTQTERDKIDELVFHLIVKENKNEEQVIEVLHDYNIEFSQAKVIYDEVIKMIRNVENTQAHKDMLYGGLWLVGGIVFTYADIGYIFWGAIVFGGYQFFKGVSNLK
jgi:hypothetical protein